MKLKAHNFQISKRVNYVCSKQKKKMVLEKRVFVKLSVLKHGVNSVAVLLLTNCFLKNKHVTYM